MRQARGLCRYKINQKELLLHRRTPTFKAMKHAMKHAKGMKCVCVSVCLCVCAKLLEQLGGPLNRDDRNEIRVG